MCSYTIIITLVSQHKIEMKLNLGCGTEVVDGWVNVDYSIGSRLGKLPVVGAITRNLKLFNVDWDTSIYLHNLTKRFPWGDGEVDIVYSSHTLEHLSRKDGKFFIAECHRVLKNNGVIRILVPDLKKLVQEYMEGAIQAPEFLERLGVLYSVYNNPVKNILSPFIGFPHKCMYDEESLLGLMTDTGFTAAIKGGFESAIPDIHGIELSSRVAESVIVEGVKP